MAELPLLDQLACYEELRLVDIEWLAKLVQTARTLAMPNSTTLFLVSSEFGSSLSLSTVTGANVG